MNRISAVVAGLSLAFVGTSATIAGTIHVPGDQPTIAAAINASVNGDVINIAAGTYNEYNLNPGGKAITIQGTRNTNGSLATTIDAQQSGRVFVFNSGERRATVIQDLTITGGQTDFGVFGGGIYCDRSSPTISGCTISGNEASAGGGIYCINSRPMISNCTISGNTAYNGGGIQSLHGDLFIKSCMITGNSAGGQGGGIYSFDGHASIRNSTVTDNTAVYGGGIDCHTFKLFLTDCTITDNTADYGGGILCTEARSSSNIMDSTISGNTAKINGGGLYMFDGKRLDSLKVLDCTLSGNDPQNILGRRHVDCVTSDPIQRSWPPFF